MQQYLDFRRSLPNWLCKCQHNCFTAKGVVQPSPLGDVYNVRIFYKQNCVPVITVLEGKLKPREPGGKIKHTYRDGTLCLYYPKAKEWTANDWISDSIVPWISVWLYYYEIWYATGDWRGGGIEHNLI